MRSVARRETRVVTRWRYVTVLTEAEWTSWVGYEYATKLMGWSKGPLAIERSSQVV